MHRIASDQSGWVVQSVSGAFRPATTILTWAGNAGNNFSLTHPLASPMASKESINSNRQSELAIAAPISCSVALVSMSAISSAIAATMAVGVGAIAEASMLAQTMPARLASFLRVCPDSSGRIAEFSEHEAD